MKNNLEKKWRATFQRRWASNPDLCHTVDPIGGHSCRVALIIQHFWPKARCEVFLHALSHDIPEQLSGGDMCGQFKRENPEIAKMKDDAESKVAEILGLSFELSKREFEMVDLADKLDAFFWMRHHAPHVEERSDWMRSRRWIFDKAKSLGVSDQIKF